MFLLLLRMSMSALLFSFHCFAVSYTWFPCETVFLCKLTAFGCQCCQNYVKAPYNQDVFSLFIFDVRECSFAPRSINLVPLWRLFVFFIVRRFHFTTTLFAFAFALFIYFTRITLTICTKINVLIWLIWFV